MCVRIVTCLILLGLLLQGVVAVGGDLAHGQDAPQHCAMDHDAALDDCPCCPDGEQMGAGCTVQCSATQAPALMRLPARAVAASGAPPFAEHAIRNPCYAPLIPPPIV